MGLKKNDKYFMILSLTAAASLFLWQRYAKPQEGVMAVVERNGEIIGHYSLDDGQRIVFEEEGYGRNVLMIRDGKAYMEEADCPDKLCVKQKPVEKYGESIICLPHRLVIRITGGEAGDTDAVVGALKLSDEIKPSG